ncbi:hypothetical protein MJ390_23215 [Klebsiella pneumoniae]|nr:hypothetical protein MJ390_23215 [Klebsiella pneumoniae]
MASGTGGFLLEPQHNVMQMGGDFANNLAAAQFIDKMVARSTASTGSAAAGDPVAGKAPGLRPAADGSSGADRPAANRADRRLAAL